ncbi:MAG: alpha/beta hydrolase, partial [Alkalibacterium sp.]
DTVYAEIEGGNHSNFGTYGFQEGDRKSVLSREKQQEETVQVISDFLKNRSEVSD